MAKKVYIASMNMRGKWADKPDNAVVLNVTSAQSKTSPNRLAFSPMSSVQIPDQHGYKGFHCFENYWQAGKVWEGVPHQDSYDWWKALTLPKRRYPKVAKGTRVLHAIHNDKSRDYVTSRTEVYIPEYYNIIKNHDQLKFWQNHDSDIVVYDFDGPRSIDHQPTCLEVTLDMLKEKVLDVTHPFGHGFIVAASILGFEPKDYI